MHRVDVRVRATVERAVERRELVSCVDGVEILLRLFDDALVAERVEVVKIRSIILMVFLHGRVEAIVRDADLLTEDRSLERLWREVALHLPDILFTEKLQVFECRVLLIIDRHRAHLVKTLVEPFEVIRQIRRNGLALLFELGNALLRLPNLVDCALDGVNQFRVHFILIVQEPRTLGSLRHIREHHHAMVKAVVPEVRAYATIGRQSLVLQLVVINELRLVNEKPRERERVGRAWAVLTDDDRHRAIIERDDMLIVSRFGDWLREGLWRFPAYHIMHAIDIPPTLPRCKQPRERVRQAMLERRHDDTTSGARHTLHVTQHERRGDGVRLAGASSGHDDSSLCADVLRQELRFVEVHTLRVLLRLYVPKGSVNFVRHCLLA